MGHPGGSILLFRFKATPLIHPQFKEEPTAQLPEHGCAFVSVNISMPNAKQNTSLKYIFLQ